MHFDANGKIFVIGQAGIALVVLLAVLRFFKQQDGESQFKLREADRPKPSATSPTEAQAKLADARMKSNRPLQLSGISITGAAHEVLGISSQATEAEVQKAYRDLMKRYHPDAVGRPGTREWQDAQKIAERINSAKTEMLEKIRTRG